MKRKNLKLKIEKGMPPVHGQAVERLAKGLQPVRPSTPIWSQWFGWIAVMAVLIMLFLSRMPLRADFAGNGSSLSFVLMVVLIFAGAGLAAWGALEASIPAGESRGKWKIWTAVFLYGLALLLFVLFTPWEAQSYPFHPHFSCCFVVVLLVGIVSWLGLGLLIRRNAPLNPRRVGVWSGISAFMIGLGVITLHCGNHNLVHVCLEHFLPVLAYSLLTGWLGFWWISSWKHKPLTK